MNTIAALQNMLFGNWIQQIKTSKLVQIGKNTNFYVVILTCTVALSRLCHLPNSSFMYFVLSNYNYAMKRNMHKLFACM